MGLFSKKKKRVLILTAPVSAGKTTVVNFLNKYRFRQYRFSEAIRSELEKRGLDTKDPRNYKQVGDELRVNFGNDVLSQRGIDALKGYKGLLVFDGARNPEEIRRLQEEFGDEVYVLAVDSPFEDRYKRYAEKFKDKGGLTVEEFKEIDQFELDSGAESGHQVAKCMRMADALISNDGDLTQFEKKVDEVVSKNFQ